jgi:hypothetical protein
MGPRHRCCYDGCVQSHDTPAAVPERHAQVAPSFILAALSHALVTPAGTKVTPPELLNWQRPEELTATTREHLRKQVLKRCRRVVVELGIRTTGVRLAPGWEQVLLSGERAQLESMLRWYAPRPLEELTLQEVREAMPPSLERVMSILARLEAVYWQPVEHTSRQRKPTPAPQTVAVTPEMRALAAEVGTWPWLDAIHPDDPRFGYPGPGPLPQWVKAQATAPRAHERLPTLLEAVVEASMLTAAEEAQALARAANEWRLNKRIADEAQDRWANIVVARYVSTHGRGRTLEGVASEFGVTRERIRQICEEFERSCAECRPATPALDRVLHAAADLVPSNLDEVNAKLAPLSGPGAGIESLLAWAQAVGRSETDVQVGRSRRRVRGQWLEVRVLEHRVAAVQWVDAALRHAGRDCRTMGCCNTVRLAGLLALHEGVMPEKEAFESVLPGVPGFRWLFKESGWFTLGDTAECSAATRVRKVMAVAHDHIATDRIAAALASDDAWLRVAHYPGLAIPPVNVLRELFMGWPWLRMVQGGRFCASESFEPEGALSESEVCAASVIEAHDGLACRFEIVDAAKARTQVTDVAVSLMLASSPIFERVEHGLYALIGRRVGDSAVASARQRARGRPQLPVQGGLQANVLTFKVTPASLRNEQYSVPLPYRRALAGRRLPLVDSQGVPVGTARINQSGALSGLNALFPGLREGDMLQVELTQDDALRASVKAAVLLVAPTGADDDAAVERPPTWSAQKTCEGPQPP